MPLSFFRALRWGAEVGDGDNAAAYCTLEGVAKLNGTDKPLLTANEFIAYRLGQLIGLPTVPGVVIGGPDRIGWVSLRFGERNERPPPVLPDEVVAAMPELAAGTVVFDCWIGNADRHDENMAFTGDAIYLFDHDRAVLGGGKRGPDYNAHGLHGHCLAGHLVDDMHLGTWVSEVKAVRDRAIVQIVADAVTENALPADRKDEAIELIRCRRDQVGAILKLALSEGCFKKITQWPLLLT